MRTQAPDYNGLRVAGGYTHEFLVYITNFHLMPSREKNITVSGMNYLHEKAEESRHNETLAYLMFIAGAVFFVGGLLETVITTEDPDWFLFFPYKLTPHAYSLLGLSMVLSGFTLLVLGIILGIHYSLDRALYMNQLKGAYAGKKRKESEVSSISHELTNPLSKQPENKKDDELKECVNYLTEKMGLSEIDAEGYCKNLGRRWRELAESKKETKS